VHFFIYNEYATNLDSIARECMRKLPYQFLEYMKKNNIDPDPSKSKKKLD